MSRPLVYVDTSDVREGRSGSKDAIAGLASHVGRAQRQVIAYNAFVSADGDQMTIVHMHPEPSSLDQLMSLAGPRFERFTELLTLRSIDVYGEPTAAALRHLENKARLLGGDVAVHTPDAGLSRLRQC